MGLVYGIVNCPQNTDCLEFHRPGMTPKGVPVNGSGQYSVVLPAGTYTIKCCKGHWVIAPDPLYSTCLPQYKKVLCPSNPHGAEAGEGMNPGADGVKLIRPSEFHQDPFAAEAAKSLEHLVRRIRKETDDKDNYKFEMCWIEERVDGELTVEYQAGAVIGKIVSASGESE